ncbi:hypothetical protein IE81DRAFT_339327 [Ceraceosorus guamensis]|uniref:CBM21 domain-containing protein n=1 Tax=Ceraceosorus guamensis TaxID=1522189 RepID=A0A316WCW0_9BASI|nr:hypothetical protein IE81DRAFT_339327 [Ceraceosorus guamensis]PWN45365.1 hypothetical protein IE81DRAFT_339327 [Ceraceosorus guamensis]
MTSATASPRPRHHSRSFSSDAEHFPVATSSRSPSAISSNALPRRARSGTSSPSPPMSGANSPRRLSNSSTSPDSIASTTGTFSESSSVASSLSHTSSTSSIATLDRHERSNASDASQPSRKRSPNGDTNANSASASDAAALERLRQAQANRRPKMLRLTPAYSSLPSRTARSPLTVELASPASSSSSTPTPRSVSDGTPQVQALAFPSKGARTIVDPPKSAPLHPSSRKALAMKAAAPEIESPGLQLDLSHLPSPSLRDLHGATTSRIPDEAPRDRNGNPLKSSLKSPGASLFLAPRADSTPSLPASKYRSAQSVPSTPTVKAVHFDPQLERVKVFKFKQRPTAVSRDGSPEHTETETEEERDSMPYVQYGRHRGHSSPEPSQLQFGDRTHFSSMPAQPAEAEEQLILRLPNFPSSTRLSTDREVFLERIFLADDLRSVKGTVQVRNMSFEKWVAVRFTLDKWATVNEVSAEYAESIKGGTADRFGFSIKLNELLSWPRGAASHETKSMYLCLRYTVTGQEFWDNNDGLNYQLDFRKRMAPSTPVSTPAAVPSAPAIVPAMSSDPGSRMRLGNRNSSLSAVPQSTNKTRVFELARRGVGTSKGGFAMEDLRRELDRLKSDEEEEERFSASVAGGRDGASSPTPNPRHASMRKFSPPASPGQRSSSPSMWTSRYDFGQSLRDVQIGGRPAQRDRASALDYFSAKPSPRTPTPSDYHSAGPVGAETPTQSSHRLAASIDSSTGKSFVANVSSPNGRVSIASTPADSPDFSHKFGMISPGLEHHVEHQPFLSTASPSPTRASPPTPLATMYEEPLGDDRFYTFPRRRSPKPSPGLSPLGAVGRVFFEGSGMLGNGVKSPAPSAIRTPSPPYVDEYNKGRLDKAAEHTSELSSSSQGLIVDDFGSPSSSPSSPTYSDVGTSFATPADSITSISSNEGELTVSASRDNRAPRYIAGQPSLAGGQTKKSAIDSSPRGSVSSLGSEGGSEGALRPSSISSMDELIARYCWNAELVPSGGSLIPTMGTDAGSLGSPSTPRAPSATASGATTPTLA